jgi:hypothetical protein
MQNLENTKKEIDEKYIIRKNTFDDLKDEITNGWQNMKNKFMIL